jgi:hypothetical protein
MYLVTADGKFVPDLVRERVESACTQSEPPCDPVTIVDRVLGEPEIVSLFESVWDDESSKALYEELVQEVRQEVIRLLRERQDGPVLAGMGQAR